MGILTHTCTKGERCKKTKRIHLSLETKICSPSSVLAPFCSSKHTETLKIHLPVISRKSKLHKIKPRNTPNEGKLYLLAGNTPPKAAHLLALTLEQALHYSISPRFTRPSPGAGHVVTAVEDGHTGEADAHPARGGVAGGDSRTSLAPGPTAAQSTNSLLIVFAACFHSARI